MLLIGQMLESALLNDDTLPSTLEECYAELDAVLSDEEIDQIRNAGNGDIFRSSGLTDDRWRELVAEGSDPVDLDLGMTHFGLGLWIRNSWLYPRNSRLTKMFINAGFRHPDYMSSFIIAGYYNYLNNEGSAEFYEKEFNKAQTDFLYHRLFLILTLIITVTATRFFLKKMPKPILLLKKARHLKFFRVSFALCISSIFANGFGFLVDSDFWINLNIRYLDNLTEVIYVILLSFVFTISALVLFVDMTRKQIAISAILPTVFFVSNTIIVEFFPYYLHYGILSWQGGQFIFHTVHITMLAILTGSCGEFFPTVLFAFFPFAYVALASSSKDLETQDQRCAAELC
jgi:hypothetical protein